MKNIHQSGDKTSPTTVSRIGVESAKRAAVFGLAAVGAVAAALAIYREGPQKRDTRTEARTDQKRVRQSSDQSLNEVDPDDAALILTDSTDSTTIDVEGVRA